MPYPIMLRECFKAATARSKLGLLFTQKLQHSRAQVHLCRLCVRLLHLMTSRRRATHTYLTNQLTETQPLCCKAV